MILRIHSVLSPENQQQQEQEVNPKLIVTPKPNHQVLPPLPIARLLLGQRIGLYCDWHRSYGLRRSLLTGELQGTSCSLSWPMPRFEPNYNNLYAAESTLDGKQKVQLDELMLPYKLLRRSEEPILLAPTAEFGAASLTNASASAATIIPTAKEDRDTSTSTFELPYYHHNMSNTPTSTLVLSANDIVDLLNFCIKMLNEQPALEIAEMDLLEMMNHLCSQPQYVVRQNQNIGRGSAHITLLFTLMPPSSFPLLFFETKPGTFSCSLRNQKYIY